MTNFLRTVLFLSAFAPVLLTMAVVRYQLVGLSTEVIQLAVIGSIGAFLPYLIVLEMSRRSEVVPFIAKKVEANDFMLVVFLVSYSLPLIARAADLSFEKVILIVVLAGALLWFITSIPAHPILRLLKIRFYKVEAENGMVYTVISKVEIRSPSQLSKVHVISSSMLMKAE